jgi:uncharacterized membrane protein (UPF0127 family)
MKKKKITIFLNKNKIRINVEKCNYLEMIKGLMFSKKENSKILLFEFKKEKRIIIHSFFVFYKFVAIWLDENNNILEIKKVSPFSLSIIPKYNSFKLIEIPLIKNHFKIIKKLNISVD